MATDVNKNIGVNLKKLRIRAGYKTAEAFASAHKLPKIPYGKIENGKINLRIGTLLKLLKIHDMTIVEFFE